MFGMKIQNYLDGQLFIYFQLFVYFSQISCLEDSDTETAQSKDVWNEKLEFLRWSVVCLLSAVCLFFSNKPLRGFCSDTETAQSKDVWNKNLEF